MTFLPPEGPLPDLSTTRVATGTSARVVSVAVAGLLVGVVGFALVNRPPAPAAPAPTAGQAAVATTPAPNPAPTPTPLRNEIEGNDGLTGRLMERHPFDGRSGRTEPLSYGYAASMIITGGVLRAPLALHVEDVYDGAVVIDSTDVGKSIHIGVARHWSQYGLEIYEDFDSWDVPLKRLRRSDGQMIELLAAHMPPRMTMVDGLEPVASGYSFSVRGWRNGDKFALFLELVWPLATQL